LDLDKDSNHQKWYVSLCIATIVFGFFVGIAAGPVDSPSPRKPSSLETFIRRPDTRVTWSKEVAHLESNGSHAIVSTLIVEDSVEPARQMRGVRVDLLRPFWKRSVYVDEGSLQQLKKTIDQLTLYIEQDHLLPGTSLGFIGSCDCRDNPDLCPLEVEFCYSGCDSGGSLKIFGPNREATWFPGVMPSHLSKALGSAIEELMAH